MHSQTLAALLSTCQQMMCAVLGLLFAWEPHAQLLGL